jgi:hypothetical protein
MREIPGIMVPVPGIREVNLDLISAKIVVAGQVDGITVPSLYIEGDPNITGGFKDGALTVRQRASEYHQTNYIGNVTHTVNVGNTTKHLVGALMLPSGYQLERCNIAAVSGNINLRELRALGVVVVGISANVSVDGLIARGPQFKTVSDPIALKNLHSAEAVTAASISGRISITGGRADFWNVGAGTGGITVSGGVIGKFVSPSSSSRFV